ncbi:MAG: hypothetical protein M3619_02480 [Myxococcota bacterium]|nr:hypothetical protein [Myxococcota bacterium]
MTESQIAKMITAAIAANQCACPSCNERRATSERHAQVAEHARVRALPASERGVAYLAMPDRQKMLVELSWQDVLAFLQDLDAEPRRVALEDVAALPNPQIFRLVSAYLAPPRPVVKLAPVIQVDVDGNCTSRPIGNTIAAPLSLWPDQHERLLALDAWEVSARIETTTRGPQWTGLAIDKVYYFAPEALDELLALDSGLAHAIHQNVMRVEPLGDDAARRYWLARVA